ncbi:putative acylaminoacyl-peptidase [Cardiosporidium cionae]|uniref:acylaminoacyl-peptidase n=1 Tax=Cardiosporidium cionae TaxID=476202 RepID=A0ABQ7J8W7_9APIC|nr:putative acylaminoacyl-peptidase [Cardiosporidium cionae]|eukprot:KAF8820438.1 putative acylaminoacyl-peptidase [Cardiosporidium cionae]
MLYVAEEDDSPFEAKNVKISQPFLLNTNKYIYKEDWGEQNAKKRNGRLFIADFEKVAVSAVTPYEGEELSYAEPQWLREEDSFVCTGWSTLPFRLGLIHCSNRPCGIYVATLAEKLSTTSETKETSLLIQKMADTSISHKNSSVSTSSPPIIPIVEGKDAQQTSEASSLPELASSKDSSKPKSLDCQWIRISTDQEFSAWSPTRLLQTGSLDENVERVAYLALDKESKDIRPHKGISHIRIVSLRWIGRNIQENAERKGEPLSSSWQILSHSRVDYLRLGDCNTYMFSHFSMPPFNGLYTLRLIRQQSPNTIYVNTFCGPVASIVGIHLDAIEASKCTLSRLRVTNAKSFLPSFSVLDSLHLLDYKNNRFLIEHQSPLSPSHVFIAILDTSAVFEPHLLCVRILALFSLGNPSMEASTNGELTHTSPSWNRFTHAHSLLLHKTWKIFEDRHIVVKSERNPEEKRKIAVVLHGGPHSCYHSGFFPHILFLMELGFDILGVNYRGSLGFGQEEVLSLLGKVGKQDVMDVKEAFSSYLKCNPSLYDEHHSVVLGGSHGGFLVCHLIGQFPSLFGAASTLNPVTDLVSMMGSTDIPDWCLAEGCDETYNPSLLLTDEQLVQLRSASPLRFVKFVETPLLLGVGGSDLRVPPSQSLQYYKLLRALRKRCRLLYFPENDHRVASLPCSENYWVNVAVWFTRWTGNPQETSQA